MKTNKLMMAVFVSLSLFVYSCGNTNPVKEQQQVHAEGDGHNHAEMVETDKPGTSDSKNENGELTDAAGNIITGCPAHNEMIGSAGDKCPKCNYMKMIPITWDIAGVDTVRVTSLPNYNPPK